MSNAWKDAIGGKPAPVGDCRKIVWIQNREGMEWWGIRAWSGEEWLNNGYPSTSETVLYYMEGPTSPHYPEPPV
jgi:hypothetical protein